MATSSKKGTINQILINIFHREGSHAIFSVGYLQISAAQSPKAGSALNGGLGQITSRDPLLSNCSLFLWLS